MTVAYPTIGRWFRRLDGSLLEVVAVDEEDRTIEYQLFDGTIGEVDLKTWAKRSLIEVAAPEDWSGSVDMDPEDYAGKSGDDMPSGFHNPLEFLEDKQ